MSKEESARDESVKKAARPRRYIREFGRPPSGPVEEAAISIAMVLLAAAVGFGAGAAVWALMGCVNLLTDLVWVDLQAKCGVPWFPGAACITGGALIALWTKFSGDRISTLEEVLAEVKRTGRYMPDSLWKSFVSFLLPLVSGGSVGPEAGLSGFIAGACTWIGDRLKRAGLKTRAVTDVSISAVLTAVFGTPLMGIAATAEEGIPDESEYTFGRRAKILLYTVSALGAFAGVALVSQIPGLVGGLPRFDAVHAKGAEHLYAIPLALVGWALAMLFHVGRRVSGSIAAKAEKIADWLPVICGAVLGTIALFLPNVCFAGEEQSIEIMGVWKTTGVSMLLLTGAVKVLVTPMCVRFGWRGGNFFPTIYAGISFGYGISMLTGFDLVMCVFSVTTSLVAGMTRRPLLTLALLLLCFPLRNVVMIAVTALIGALMPMPSALDPGHPDWGSMLRRKD